MMDTKNVKGWNEKALGNTALFKVIHDHFYETPEIFEIAVYAMGHMMIEDAVMQAIMGEKTEMSGVPPEMVHLVRRFDNGLIDNGEFHATFATVKSQLALSDIKLNSMRNMITQGERVDDKQCYVQAKAILMSRYDIFTVIALNWKGVTYAEDFDLKIRMAIDLGPEMTAYFEKRGV